MALPIASVFEGLTDPRRETLNKRHLLTDILTIATCAVIGGADTWDDIAEFGQTKQEFFRRFLSLPNGVPSPDTFARVFAKLDPDAFAQAFGTWMASACEATGLLAVAIDGKSARGAKMGTATGCLHVVSAWATANRLTLGQVAVPEGSNEIAVIPELLRALDLKGAIVTLDAAGCQVENAALIRQGEGHYLLAVKGNQPSLHGAVQAVFERAVEADFKRVKHDTHGEIEGGHGRHEERYVTVIYGPKGLPEAWAGVKAVIHVGREREWKGRNASTSHYYVTSHAGAAAELAGLIRGHWAIESMHWVLDVVFREDQSRVREGHAGANLAMIRKVALALLKRAPGKRTTPTKRLKAGWDDNYLLQVLHGLSPELVR
jgi:predicted transposase YbfD/YdcC